MSFKLGKPVIPSLRGRRGNPFRKGNYGSPRRVNQGMLAPGKHD